VSIPQVAYNKQYLAKYRYFVFPQAWLKFQPMSKEPGVSCELFSSTALNMGYSLVFHQHQFILSHLHFQN